MPEEFPRLFVGGDYAEVFHVVRRVGAESELYVVLLFEVEQVFVILVLEALEVLRMEHYQQPDLFLRAGALAQIAAGGDYFALDFSAHRARALDYALAAAIRA